MLNDIYNKKIIELAGNIPRLGRLADPDASATAHSKLCGSTVKVDLKMNGEVVSDFGHEVKACALGQASSSIMARHVVGSTADDLRRVFHLRDFFLRDEASDFDIGQAGVKQTPDEFHSRLGGQERPFILKAVARPDLDDANAIRHSLLPPKRFPYRDNDDAMAAQPVGLSRLPGSFVLQSDENFFCPIDADIVISSEFFGDRLDILAGGAGNDRNIARV